MGPCYGPFDSGGVCSMGPHFVYGIYKYALGSRLGPILGAHSTNPWGASLFFLDCPGLGAACDVGW